MKLTDLTNTASTVTAVLTILLGVMTQVLGCTSVGDLHATCTAAFLSPDWAGYAALFFAASTIILKFLRPGGALHSLFGRTAVVVPEGKAGVGTVTPAQVAEP
jgi:hypothetical protein